MTRVDQCLYGLDVGSTTAKLSVLNASLDVLHQTSRRTHGRPLETALALLEDVPAGIAPRPGSRMAHTGTGGKLLAGILGGEFFNEIIAHTTAATHFHPGVRTLLDIGGQDTKLVLLAPGADGTSQIEDFSLNTLCAAGTGSFLDQQAARLGLDIETFSRLAESSASPARLAGRCTVFAKSDMIHLQQTATPREDIVAGLCLALIRNLKATLGKGKRIMPPLVFQGGVAANLGVQRAVKEILGLRDEELIIPVHHNSMGAIGAALRAARSENAAAFQGLAPLKRYLDERPDQVRRHAPLVRPVATSSRQSEHQALSEASSGSGRPVIQGWLGVDVGSVSTKMVILDPETHAILARFYGQTAGQPLAAIQRGLSTLKTMAPPNLAIAAVGTTGSGRHLAGDFLGADAVINEITAQAKAAVILDPMVDTIFEIGGQDSKYIRIENGQVADFMMNRACAAGTGSFLEEQAGRLGIELENFGAIALSAKAPVVMGERCTVFMESDLVHYLQQGVPISDLVAGLCYSIVHNYLNKVVEKRPIGQRIFYQGATALNQGIVAAFEAVLGTKVFVPGNCNLTGAMGAALLSGEARPRATAFRGFDVTRVPFETRTFECRSCPNQCAINRVKVAERQPLFYGGRCDRYEGTREAAGPSAPDLLALRQQALVAHCYDSPEEAHSCPRGPMGLPLALLYQEWLPFFSTMLREMGFGPVMSGPTTRAVVQKGVETVINEPCFPVKIAHGHAAALIEGGVEALFVPSFIEMRGLGGHKTGQTCPYVQSLPYVLSAALDFASTKGRVLSLPLRLGGPDRDLARRVAKLFKVGVREASRAIGAGWEAQAKFQNGLFEAGEEALARLGAGDLAVVLVGRPYNALDPGSNLGLHHKLRRLGVPALPFDALPLLDEAGSLPGMESMYWRYGQRILAAGDLIRKDPRLHALYVTNFGCGPDSFLLHFFREIQGEKPFLEIEIDEHSADAGAVTRLEAFLDTARGSRTKPRRAPAPTPPAEWRQPKAPAAQALEQRVLYIPHMSDHAYALAAAVRACGGSARVLSPTDEASLDLGLRHTSGKECYPAILTTGDMAKMTLRQDFDPTRSAFFMPAGGGPCRFGQYHQLHRRVLDNLGFDSVPIYTPNQDITLYDELGIMGKGFSRMAWQGVVAVDLLDRLLRSLRPHSDQPGQLEALYRRGLDWICSALEARVDLAPVLHALRRQFDALGIERRPRPVIGIIGEIYTRVNDHANDSLVRDIEALGGEVLLPTVSEWILYVNFTAKRRARRQQAWREYARLTLENVVQITDARRLERAMGPLPGGREPLTKDLLNWAEPYVSDEFEGETILSVGKAVEFTRHGTAGLINVLPFTCMPGTIVNALVNRIRHEVGARPFLALSCDGQQQTGRRLRLEAFMHQAAEVLA